ncbi:glycosyltransferase [Aeromonas jandaei]|uniref:glycosyltransferase n=1 Tax=Aeromonas jandaei TaxID=650 RepID=UPI0038B5FDD2
MKKILHLTHTDIRSDSRIIKEMDAAYKAGYDIVGIGIHLDEGGRNVGLDQYNIITLNVFSKRLTFLPKVLRHGFTFFEFCLKSFFFALKNRPDIIHCNDTLVLPVGLLVKLFSGAKLVYDAHELESDKNGLSRFLGKATLSVERLIWPYIDALIVVSPSIDNWYKNKLGKKNSAIVLNSPVYNADFESDKKYLRRKFEIPDDKKIFLYVGILGPGRGIDAILEVFKVNSKSHLVFLGYGEYADKIKHISTKYGNIHVHDSVSHEKVVEISSSADIGLCLIENVSLSDYYCLPNKLFEYAFSGVPILASNFPDISSVVVDYGLGICVDLSVESIDEGVKRFEAQVFCFNQDKCDLSGLAWAAQAEKLIKLYSQLN